MLKTTDDRVKELEKRLDELERRIDKNMGMIMDTFATMQDIIERVSDEQDFSEKRKNLEKSVESANTKKPFSIRDVINPARRKVKENIDFIQNIASEDLVELKDEKKKK